MGRRKKFNRLPEAKQLAKQLLLHRVWNGKSQSNIADVLEVTFQQYQKIENGIQHKYKHCYLGNVLGIVKVTLLLLTTSQGGDK